MMAAAGPLDIILGVEMLPPRDSPQQLHRSDAVTILKRRGASHARGGHGGKSGE